MNSDDTSAHREAENPFEKLDNRACADKKPERPDWNASRLRMKVTAPSIGVSLLLYAIVIGVNLDADVKAKQVEAFGSMPFGLHVTLVVSLIQSLLFIPIPWVTWHLMRLTYQARQDGRDFGFGYLMTIERNHPNLRYSALICLGGLMYFILICAVWIIYAATRGI